MTDHEASARPAPSDDRPPGGRWRRWHLTSRDAIIALTVAVLTIGSQAIIDDRREDKADRRENLRFLREQAAAGNLREVQLFNIDVAGQNLGGLELSGAQMPGAVLQSADLSGVSITDSNLWDADMRSARLVGSTLERSNLAKADMRRADLSDARLVDASLMGADFTGARLAGTLFENPLGWEVEMRYTRFTVADLRGADLENTHFDRVSFYGADLRGAKLNIQPNEVICYGPTTKWPQGFRPPFSADPDDCRLE